MKEDIVSRSIIENDKEVGGVEIIRNKTTNDSSIIQDDINSDSIPWEKYNLRLLSWMPGVWEDFDSNIWISWILSDIIRSNINYSIEKNSPILDIWAWKALFTKESIEQWCTNIYSFDSRPRSDEKDEKYFYGRAEDMFIFKDWSFNLIRSESLIDTGNYKWQDPELMLKEIKRILQV